MGAERLHHRLRRRPRPGRPLGRPGRAQEGLPHRAGRLHRLLGALRAWPRRSASSSPPASCRRPAAPSCCPPRSACSCPPSAPRARERPSGCGRPSAARPPPSAPPSAACWSRSSWRWVFLVNLPFSVLALVFGRAPARARCATRTAHKSDLLGAGAALRRPWPAWSPASSRARTGAGPARAIVGAFVLAVGVGRLARGALVPPPQPHHRAGRDPPPRGGPGRRELARLLRRLRRAGARAACCSSPGSGTSRSCAPAS